MSKHRLPAPPGTGSAGRGFTLVESAAVLAIVALLAAFAVPPVGALLERSRLLRTRDDLSAAIYLARAEALRRGGGVSLRSMAAAGCSAAEARDWSCGWQVVASDGFDRAEPEAAQPIQTWIAPHGVQVQVNAPGSAGHLEVNRWGRFHTLGAFSIDLRPAGSIEATPTLRLCMSSAGRLQTVRERAAC